jgi:L-rhamnose mutarotase
MTYRAGLRPGSADVVTAAYRDLPREIRDAIRAAGVRRQWTWVEEGDAWTYLECDDLDATEAAFAASDRYRAWTASLAPFLDERTQRDGPRRTREVFRCD